MRWLAPGVSPGIVDALSSAGEPVRAPIVFSGGVSRNRAVVAHLERMLGTGLICEKGPSSAAGAALCLLDEATTDTGERFDPRMKSFGPSPVGKSTPLHPLNQNDQVIRISVLPRRIVSHALNRIGKPGGSRNLRGLGRQGRRGAPARDRRGLHQHQGSPGGVNRRRRGRVLHPHRRQPHRRRPEPAGSRRRRRRTPNRALEDIRSGRHRRRAQARRPGRRRGPGAGRDHGPCPGGLRTQARCGHHHRNRRPGFEVHHPERRARKFFAS